MTTKIPVQEPVEPPITAPAIAPGGSNLDPMCRQFASMGAGEADTLIDAYVVQAIREWRVADATFWQRVKFRARVLRAKTRHQHTVE